MKGMKLTQQSIGIKSALSLVAFICYTYLVLSNDMGKLFYYVVIAYSLTSLYIILPCYMGERFDKMAYPFHRIHNIVLLILGCLVCNDIPLICTRLGDMASVDYACDCIPYGNLFECLLQI